MPQHRKPGPKPNSANTRQRILDAAQRLIAEKGVDQLRLQDIANEVGIRPPSVFGHFNGLDAVTETVFRQVLEGLIEAMAIAPTADVMDDLKLTLSRLTEFLATDAANVRLILQQLGSQGQAMKHFHSGSAIVETFDNRVKQLLDRGVATGVYRPVIAADFVAMVSGALLARLSWQNFADWQQPDWPQRMGLIKAEIIELALGYLGVQPDQQSVRKSA